MRSICAILFCFLLAPSILFAQYSSDSTQPHFNIPPKADKKRLAGVSSGIVGVYAGTFVGLNYLWYADYPRSKFHFFNDNGEWMQVDKLGHAQTAYFESYWVYNMYRWCGLSNNKSAWIGGSTAFLLQATIELFDGLSAEWGASPGDLLANFGGATLFTTQQLLWKEQRILFKISPHYIDYPVGELDQRAANLYGTNFIQRSLKDYNAQTYWLSFNIAAFNKKQQHAKWLNLAVGYGADGMYGGFENKWIDEDGKQIDRTDIKRYRQFYVSVDADFSRIPARTKTGKVLLGMLNVIKLPAPALEINTKGEFIFHPLFFMNWEVPLYIVK